MSQYGIPIEGSAPTTSTRHRTDPAGFIDIDYDYSYHEAAFGWNLVASEGLDRSEAWVTPPTTPIRSARGSRSKQGQGLMCAIKNRAEFSGAKVRFAV